MTDYWKSNEKKYCDFCKCWITDNKVTIITHEGGRKHKENVAKRISDINKKSTKDHKIQMKLDDEMSKMERNAMASYLKDIQSNADLTSQLINQKLAETDSVIGVRSIKEPSNVTCTPPNTKKKSKWNEMKSGDGKTYYWNTESNETSWEPPSEGFAPLKGISKTEKRKKNKEEKKTNKIPFAGPKESTSTYVPSSVFGPQAKEAPYGSWTPITPVPTIDLQLPEQKYTAPVVVPTTIEPQEKKFKEKQVVKLEESETTTTEFKKRKINSSAKRNTRQRLDDD